MNKKISTYGAEERCLINLEEHCLDSYWKVVGNHIHRDTLQFFYMEKGEGTFYCGKRYLSLSDGDFVLINCNEYHSCEIHSPSAIYKIIKIDLELLAFYCPMDSIAKCVRDLRHNHVLLTPNFKDDEICSALKQLMFLYEAQPDNCQIKMLSLLLDIIYRLFDKHIGKSFTEKDAAQLGITWNKLQEVREYLDSNYESRITLEQMAEFAGMSKGYFCTKFKQNTGKSFVDYLNLLRIEKATVALSNSDAPVIDISLSVGFEDVNYFCRVFKRYMGVSPSGYRKIASK